MDELIESLQSLGDAAAEADFQTFAFADAVESLGIDVSDPEPWELN